MIAQSPYTLDIATGSTEELKKNSWLVILHASRIPPHAGMLVNGNYSSLTIKGHELNIPVEVLLKTIQQKKIESIFIKLAYHPVFSFDYQNETLHHFITRFKQVKANEATCLSPVKLFLQEFYAIPYDDNELLFELTERLKQNHYIEKVIGINTNDQIFALPMYSREQLNEVIKAERAGYYND